MLAAACSTVVPTARSPEHQGSVYCTQLAFYGTLMEWGRDLTAIQDARIEPLSGDTICHAIFFASQLRNLELPPPMSVVLALNGGIVFQRQDKEVLEVYFFWNDRVVQYQRFQGRRLVERQKNVVRWQERMLDVGVPVWSTESHKAVATLG
jgi:hypothetical protein